MSTPRRFHSLSHVGLTLAAQALVALVAARFGAHPGWGTALGGCLACGFYVGRELEQLHPHYGLHGFERITLTWQAAREAGYPILAAAAVVALVTVLL